MALHDPYVKSDRLESVLKNADVVFIAMNHDAYRDMDKSVIRKNAKSDALICDVWNISGTGKIFYFASEIR